MIGYLEGVVRKGVVVTSGGVGYVVRSVVPLPEGTSVQLYVTTVVRDGAIDLYGFADEDTQGVFGRLTKVSGVGPSMALSMLRDLGTAGVVAAVVGGDPKALTKAAGVGPKAAAAVVSLARLPKDLMERAVHTGEREVGLASEVVAALEVLGYGGDAAREAVRAASEAMPGAPEEVLIGDALARLRRPGPMAEVLA